MAVKQSFEDFFSSELEVKLLELDAHRRSFAWMAPVGIVLLIGMVILLFSVLSNDNGGPGLILAILGAIGGAVLLGLYAHHKGNYVNRFKAQIVSEVIRYVNPSFRYQPDQYISKRDYEKSGLFLETTSRFDGDDYVEGVVDKTVFCFSELHSQKRVSDGKNTHYETIFRGLFFIGDFNKNFHGRTYAWSRQNPQLNFFSKIFSSFAWNLEKVTLESPDFANRFVVYSNDQVEARYILTPSFMERLMRLQQLLGNGTAVSFVDTNIYVAVPIRGALFEPTIFRSNSFETVRDYLTTVEIVMDIIDELKLNERLWNKD